MECYGELWDIQIQVGVVNLSYQGRATRSKNYTDYTNLEFGIRSIEDVQASEGAKNIVSPYVDGPDKHYLGFYSHSPIAYWEGEIQATSTTEEFIRARKDERIKKRDEQIYPRITNTNPSLSPLHPTITGRLASTRKSTKKSTSSIIV